MKIATTISVTFIATAFVIAAMFVYVANKPQQDVASDSEIILEEHKPLKAEELFQLVNKERIKVGVAPLILDDTLVESARMKSDDMAQYKYFEHVNHDGSRGYSYILKTKPECHILSENLSYGHATEESAVRGWVNSPAHYAAIIDPKVTFSGISVNGKYVTQHFCGL